MNQEKMVQAANFHEESEQEFWLDNILENMTNRLFYLFLITGIPLILHMIFQIL